MLGLHSYFVLILSNRVVYDCIVLAPYRTTEILEFQNPVLLFLGVFVSLVFSLVFWVFSAHFSGFLRVRKVRKFLGVFEVFLGIFEKTKEKKDRTGPTRKPRHASVFSTHSDKQAVPAFHCIRMFEGIF